MTAAQPFGSGITDLPKSLQKTPTGTFGATSDGLYAGEKQATANDKGIANAGGPASQDVSHNGLLIELDGKQLPQVHENMAQSKNSNPTVTTAANTASVMGTSQGAPAFTASEAQRLNQNIIGLSSDSMKIPIGLVEGFYSPMINEKSHEIDRIRQRVNNYKKERYACARELKTRELLQKQLHEENLNLRKQINQLMIAKLSRKPITKQNPGNSSSHASLRSSSNGPLPNNNHNSNTSDQNSKE